VLAWQLGALSRRSVTGLGPIAWSFFAVQIISLALSWTCFSAPPSVFSGVVATCLGVAAWTSNKERIALDAPTSGAHAEA
jgi:hypothetical protein